MPRTQSEIDQAARNLSPSLKARVQKDIQDVKDSVAPVEDVVITPATKEVTS